MNEKPVDHDDNLLDTAIAEFRRMPVPATPVAGILLETIPVYQPVTTKAGRRSPLSRRRPFLRRHFHFVAAAAILAAFVLGWLLFSPSERVAIAQVIEAAAKHTVARCNLHLVARFKEEFKDIYVGDATNDYVLFVDLQSPRMRLEQRSSKTLNDVAEQSSEEILDFGEDRYLQIYRFDLIMTEKEAMGDEMQTRLVREILGNNEKGKGPHRRTARLIPLSRRRYRQPPYTDLGKELLFLEKLQTLQNNPKTASAKDKLGGRDTIKYSLEEAEWRSVVWADPKTKLPVRIEHEVVGEGAGKQASSITWEYTNFEWDPKVENVEALFSTKPPEGYALQDYTVEK